jgi:putative ABC transport system permease protein
VSITRPPRLTRALVALATQPEERPWLLADLDELYAAKRAAHGEWRAAWWYRWQVIRSIPPLLGRRMRRRTSREYEDASPEGVSPAHPPAAGTRAGLTPLPMPLPTTTPARPTERTLAVAYNLRHGFRRLVREPAFTAAAVLTLALGVGANVAVFAVVEAVLLRPLGYADADRLVILNHRDQRTGITKEFIAMGDYVDIVARQSSFEVVAGYGSWQAMTLGDGEPYRVPVLGAAPGLLEALRVRPILGRTIQPEDSRPDAAPVMLLGHELWKTRFGGDPAVVGRSVHVNQQDRTIVGVAPSGFQFPPTATTGLILPQTIPVTAPTQRKNGWIFAVARLKPGRTVEDGSADLAKVSRQLEQEYPQQNQASTYYAVSLRDALVGNTKPALVLLLAAVGVVLLIACANVANLLLARSLARRREMALRTALGAGRSRLAAQLLSESLALAVVASIVGVLFANWGARALVSLVPASVNVPGLSDINVNGPVLAFALGLTALTTVAFGLVAMTTVRLEGAAAILVGGGRLSMSGAARRAASALVIAEVALAVVLLVGAGLIVRTFSELLSVDPGFRVDRVMTMEIGIPADRYKDVEARAGYYRRAFATLRALPGVQEVGAAVVTPLTGNNWTVPFERPEQPVASGERAPDVGWQVASGPYFRALDIPLLAGRLFDERDRPDSPPVVIVSEAIQKRFFTNESAIGKRVKTGDETSEIVGVVGDIRRAGLRDDPRADMYFPFERGPNNQITLFVRTSGDPDRAVPALQSALKSVDSRTVVESTQSLAAIASESVRTTKLVLWLLGIFAATALILAAVGIYGVMSYVVRQRTREIGTRIALGATRHDILWLVMREGVLIAAGGTIAGLLIGLAATRSLTSILYGVSASDPATLAVAATVLMATIMAACYLPARRAASVDPARTLAEL